MGDWWRMRLRSERSATRFGRIVTSVALIGSAVGLVGCSAHDDPAPSPSRSPVQVFDRSGTHHVGFTSPSGNIACAFDASTTTNAAGSVRCEITVKDWTPPAQPAACNVDRGLDLTLESQAQLLCAGDTVRASSSPLLLPYGTSIRFTPFTCTSQPAGIDCENTVTRAGFLLSRERYELRNP